MSLRRFITERTKLRVGSSVKVLEEEAIHIRRSLRLQPNDEIILFNGEREYRARLKIVSKDVVMAEIVEVLADAENVTSKEFTLFQGIIRPSNFELVLQKTTELGVNTIVPLEMEFSQINLQQVEKKTERWQKIVVEACKQSERSTIPQVKLPIDFEDINEIRSEFDMVIIFTVSRAAGTFTVTPIQEMAEKIKASNKIAYVIGPEGGLSPNEHKLAASWQMPFVSLGGSVLKAETAAIAAQSVLNYIVA